MNIDFSSTKPDARILILQIILVSVMRFSMQNMIALFVIMDILCAIFLGLKEAKDFPVNLRKLQQKFCKDAHPTVIHDACSIEHIFGELYSVPEKIKIPYFKIKILELFLYLYALELPKTSEEKPYFYRTQVEKTKAIKNFLAEHKDENFTQEQLAEMFDIPITAMKNCFKTVYGMPIGSWLMKYRMNYAAEVLIAKRDISIAELAGEVGYDSPSKFAIAFRKVMGMSPTEYRSRRNNTFV